MSEFIEIDVQRLSGRALDWAALVARGYVADADSPALLRKTSGEKLHVPGRYPFVHACADGVRSYVTPSTRWEDCGPYLAALVKGGWDITAAGGNVSIEHPEDDELQVCGSDLMEEACRAYVLWKFGRTIYVPAPLAS